jgi:hypothetical protein
MTIFQLKKTNKVCCAIRITDICLFMKKLEIAYKVKLTCIYKCKEVPKEFIRNVLKSILTERGSRYFIFLDRECIRIWALEILIRVCVYLCTKKWQLPGGTDERHTTLI